MRPLRAVEPALQRGQDAPRARLRRRSGARGDDPTSPISCPERLWERRAARSAARLPARPGQGLPRAARRARRTASAGGRGEPPRGAAACSSSSCTPARSSSTTSRTTRRSARGAPRAARRLRRAGGAERGQLALLLAAGAPGARSRLRRHARLASHERRRDVRCMRCHEGQALDLTVRVDELAAGETPGGRAGDHAPQDRRACIGARRRARRHRRRRAGRPSLQAHRRASAATSASGCRCSTT